MVETEIQAKCNELRNKVDAKLEELEAEINNETNPGFGPESKRILREFAGLFGVTKIDPLSHRSTSVQARQKLVDAYRKKIYALMENRMINIRKEMTPSNNNYQ